MEANPANFEPVFLMAAYDQELEVPHIKALLRRADKKQRGAPFGAPRCGNEAAEVSVDTA